MHFYLPDDMNSTAISTPRVLNVMGATKYQIQSVQNETHVCLGANNTKPNRRKIPIFITTLDWNWQKTLARASNIEDSPCFGL